MPTNNRKKRKPVTISTNLKNFVKQFDNALTEEDKLKLVAGLYNRAARGNIPALKLILQILGEQPTGEQESGQGREALEFVWVGEEEPGQPGGNT